MTGRYLRWSEDDKAILREIWSSPEPIDSQVHRLPGRTVDQLRQKANALKLGKKPRGSQGWKRIRALLTDGPLMTTQDIADKVHLSGQQVRDLLDAAELRGDVHVFDWVRVSRNGRAQKRYRLGSGQNATEPAHFTAEQCQERWLKKQDPQELFVRRRRHYTRKLVSTGQIVQRDPLVAALFGGA